MIHVLNICGKRDRALANLMEKTLREYCVDLANYETRDFDEKGWGNGAGWEASMMKFEALKSICRFGIADNDYIISVDSDVVFTSRDVFEHLHTSDIMGIQNFSKAPTAIGPLNHFSGCFMAIKALFVKRFFDLSQDQLKAIRADFKLWTLCENEDVVISYLVQMFGGVGENLPGYLYDGNFEQDIENSSLKSFYHLNYAPTSFLGVPVISKWEIPAVIEKLGIKL